MQDGMRRGRRQLSPEEKWEVFLEVASQQLTQADAAASGASTSVVIRLRALARDAALAAFASAKPGRPASIEQVELELLRAENDPLSEALKELAVELALYRGRLLRVRRAVKQTFEDQLCSLESTGRDQRFDVV
jgi:transposase